MSRLIHRFVFVCPLNIPQMQSSSYVWDTNIANQFQTGILLTNSLSVFESSVVEQRDAGICTLCIQYPL